MAASFLVDVGVHPEYRSLLHQVELVGRHLLQAQLRLPADAPGEVARLLLLRPDQEEEEDGVKQEHLKSAEERLLPPDFGQDFPGLPVVEGDEEEAGEGADERHHQRHEGHAARWPQVGQAAEIGSSLLSRQYFSSGASINDVHKYSSFFAPSPLVRIWN